MPFDLTDDSVSALKQLTRVLKLLNKDDGYIGLVRTGITRDAIRYLASRSQSQEHEETLDTSPQLVVDSRLNELDPSDHQNLHSAIIQLMRSTNRKPV